MINRVILMGRLCADPELKHTNSGLPVTSFRIAVDRNYVPAGGERQADFIDVVAWRGTAEFVCRNFCKGSLIAVDGQLQSRNYQTKDGQNRAAIEVVADNVSFTGERRDAAETPRNAPVSNEQRQGENLPSYDEATHRSSRFAPNSYQTADTPPQYSRGAAYDPRYAQGQIEPPYTAEDDLPWNRGDR